VAGEVAGIRIKLVLSTEQKIHPFSTDMDFLLFQLHLFLNFPGVKQRPYRCGFLWNF